MKVDIHKASSGVDRFKPIINYRKSVQYGIPKTTSTRDVSSIELNVVNKNGKVQTRKVGAGTLTNADILAIMEAGSIPNNLPPRALLGPVQRKNSAKIKQYFASILKYLLEGEDSKADALMEELALRMETWTKAFFVDPENHWAPNSPSTIAAKHSDRPLIDTGELRKAIRGLVTKN